MKSKFTILLFAILACTNMLFAQSGTCGTGLTWNLSNGVLTISGTGQMTNYASREAPWYSYRTNITEVIIESSVTSIGKSAFLSCSNMTTISIPSGLNTIGDYAFDGCSSLSSIAIPEGVKSIGRSAFSRCQMTSITIPESLTSIGEWAFYSCSKLKTVIWNAKKCADFTGSSDQPFHDTYPISFIFGENVKHIPACLCIYMYGLTSVTIPDNVETIGRYAFYECQALNAVTIGSGVKSIGESAFGFTKSDNCRIKSVGWNAKNCADFTTKPFESTITSFTFGEEVEHIPALLCTGMELLTSLTLSSKIKSIGAGAFSGCIGLTSIEIPNSVTSIGASVFSGCSSLTSIDIPDSVTNIGFSDFSGCSSLTSITIGNSVESIGGYAFSGCSALSSIIVPNSVTSIGDFAFHNCSNLSSIKLSENIVDFGSNIFYSCDNLPIINNIRYADTYLIKAMYTALSSYTIKEGTKWIGTEAFSGCSSLASLTLPNSVIGIGVSAFKGCSSLASINIPDSVTIIRSGAFENCGNLQSIILPNSITNIDGAFRSSGIKSINIPNSITSIGDATFMYCGGLDSINLPNSIVSIGIKAFYNCGGLTSITIPDGVESIGEYAFNGCSGLNSLIIGKHVSSISNNAFNGCNSLSSIVVKAKTPPTIPTNTFPIPYIIIPCGTLQAYTEANNWSQYEFTEKELNTTTILPSKYGTGEVTYPTNCGISIISATPTYGYHFTQWSDGNTENPRYILLTQDTTFSAEFEKNQYEVHTASNYDFRGSTIGDTVAFYLDTIEVQAIPNYGYHFAYWLEHDQYSNPCKFAVTQNEMLTAVFEPNKYTISVSGDLEQGVVRGENGEYDYSSELHYEAIPNNGYYFTQWSDGSTDNPRTITLTQDTAFNAEFAVLPCEQYSFYYDTTIVACGGEYISWRRYEHIPADVQGIYHYYDSLHTITGCDSVFSLTLVVGSPSYMIYYDTITEGYNLYPIGIITESGIYRDTLRTMFGCDSIQEWHIHVLPALSGKCGDSAYWDLDTISGVLMISGNGPMYNYKSASLPWRKYAQYITSAQVQEGITHLSAYAFEDIRTLLNVHLPSTLETMGNMSFYCAVNIGTITCDAIIPPTGGTFKGVNSNAIIYVPCGTKGAYTDSNNWGWYFPNIEDGTYEFIEDTLICYGADLNWRGQYHLPYYSDTVIYHNDNSTLYKFGGGQAMFMDSLKSMQGCDSVYVLNAYIAPHYYEIIYDTINEGESHWAVRGNILSDTVHYNYYSTILGCDSIQEWHITVLPKSFPAPDYMFERLYGDCASKLKFTNTSHVINKFEGYENHTSYPCDACRWTFRSLSNSVIYTTTEWSPIYTCPEEGDTIEVTLTAYLGYESDSTRIDTIIVPNIMPQHTEFFYITTEDSPIKFDGRWFNRDTTYIAHYFNTYGCDSTSTLHLQVMHNYTISLLANSSKYGYVEGGGIYKQDTTITITAIPNKGYQFNQWSDGNTDNPRQVIVTQDSVFTAIFGVKMCSWLVESNDLEMGAVITNFNNEYYQYGTQITVEASPNSGYKFVKWNDGKKFNPYKFSILDDKYLLAIFMEEEEEQDTTTVSPTSTTATFTWPFIIGGFSYSLTIYLDVACTIPFCTITFNQYGQLIGITFGNRAPRRRMEQEDGFTYTVSGLDANTEYYFKMEAMDEDNKLINTDEGAFRTTNDATGIENQYNTVIEHRKVMINGQIYILRGDKTYTIQGQEVK